MEKGGVLVKIQLTLKDDLVKKMDEVVARTYGTRTSFITMAIVNEIAKNEMSGAMDSLSGVMRSILEKGEVDPEDAEKLKAFSALAEAMKAK